MSALTKNITTLSSNMKHNTPTHSFLQKLNRAINREKSINYPTQNSSIKK
jgi:hypothetical protein